MTTASVRKDTWETTVVNRCVRQVVRMEDGVWLLTAVFVPTASRGHSVRETTVQGRALRL